jgi:hypothetical protein
MGGFQGQSGSYGSYSSGGIPPMQIPGIGNSYPHGSPYYSNGGMHMGVGSGYEGSSMPLGMSPSMYHDPSMPMAVSPTMSMGVSPSYHGSSMPIVIPGHSRSHSSSVSYPQAYMGSAMSAGGMGGVPQAQTIVIHKPHKKHKHRSHHRRSRSSNPEYYH